MTKETKGKKRFNRGGKLLVAPPRHDRHLTHLMTRKGRYACGVGKGGSHTEDPLAVTCEKCRNTTAFKKATSCQEIA